MYENSSRVFVPNRALGYVSNKLPLQVRYIERRKENFIVTCVGRAFHTYDCSHFSLLSVSNLHDDDITCLASDTYHIYTSTKGIIYAWRRGTELKHTYKQHETNVHLMLPFGEHLIAIDESSLVKIWDIKAETQHSEITFRNDDFKITTVLHPSTYINKMLFASEQGFMQLWNINKMKCVYTFKGWDVAVTCLEQAPALDVVAVGLTNGHIVLHNLKYDETLFELNQDWGPVRTISFRLDGASIMTSGSDNGNVVLWDLEEKRVNSQLICAHDKSVTGMRCLLGEPLMVTSSPDNTLKLWIFDMPDGGARLLRIREGHSGAPSFIRFHDPHNIISAGLDSSLRIFNLKNEQFNKSLGRASYNRKKSKKKKSRDDRLVMPPIVRFTHESNREKDWDDLCAMHKGLAIVTTWSYDRLKMGELKLVPERFKNTKALNRGEVKASCLTMTRCGNFVVVGYTTGHVERFNVQSGLSRFSYGEDGIAHDGVVSGVAVNEFNQFVVTGGHDKSIKFWRFKSNPKPFAILTTPAPITFFAAGPNESSLICVALQNNTCRLLDINTRTIVRSFGQHSNKITDVAFSPDGRWLITTGADCFVKTWDVPTGQLIDRFKLPAQCTSIAFSPTSEYLGITLKNHLGIFLWKNATLYKRVSLRPISDDEDGQTRASVLPLTQLVPTKLPTLELDEEELYKSPQQLSNDLITLSLLPNSRWQNLLNIDVIRQRNKPKQPLKVPKSAPFFLPTIPSLDLKFDLSGVDPTEVDIGNQTHDFSNLGTVGRIVERICDDRASNNCEGMLENVY